MRVTYSQPVGTTSFYFTANIAEVSATTLSTTIPFRTLSTKAPPVYISTFGINKTAFTYIALVFTMGAVAVAIVIAYPKKPKSQATPSASYAQ